MKHLLILLALLPMLAFSQYRGDHTKTNLGVADGNGYVFRGRVATIAVEDTWTPNFDNNLIAWYDFTELATITKDGSNKVSSVSDKGDGHYNLIQVTADLQPIFSSSGITTDGSNDRMLTTGLTLSGDKTIYIVIKRLRENEQCVIASVTPSSLYIYFHGTTALYGFGAVGPQTFAVNDTKILTIIDASARSIQANNNTASTSSGGPYSALGEISIGARGDGTACNNALYKEIIIRQGVDDTSKQTEIKAYLSNKHGVTL